MPMAMMALTAPGPNTAVMRIASNKAGKANITSLPRITISSVAPRRAALSSPSGTPTQTPMITESSATPTEVSAPCMIIDKTSRPS